MADLPAASADKTPPPVLQFSGLAIGTVTPPPKPKDDDEGVTDG